MSKQEKLDKEPRRYDEENKRRKKAVDREREFFENEVLNQGVKSESTPQNEQSNVERQIEEAEERRSS